MRLDKVIPQLFDEQVEKTPDNIAVSFEDDQLTYRELNDKSNRLANYLIKKGVKSGTIIAICIERSIDLIISLLGILKVGGVYVPLDPNYPVNRLRYMLEDTNASFIISQRTLKQKLPKTQAITIYVLAII